MAEREETNVRLPVCAHDALAVIAARRGCSRDETVRQLPWPGGSIVEEFATNPSAEVLQWLAVWARKARQRVLDRSMEQTWQHAFSRPGRMSTTRHDQDSSDDLVTPTVISTGPMSFEMDSDDDLPF